MTTRSMLLLQLVGCGVFFQAVPGALPDALAQQTAAIEQSDSPADAANPQASLLNVELPDSPGAVVSKLHQSTAQQDAAGQYQIPKLQPNPRTSRLSHRRLLLLRNPWARRRQDLFRPAVSRPRNQQVWP